MSGFTQFYSWNKIRNPDIYPSTVTKYLWWRTSISLFKETTGVYQLYLLYLYLGYIITKMMLPEHEQALIMCQKLMPPSHARWPFKYGLPLHMYCCEHTGCLNWRKLNWQQMAILQEDWIVTNWQWYCDVTL